MVSSVMNYINAHRGGKVHLLLTVCTHEKEGNGCRGFSPVSPLMKESVEAMVINGIAAGAPKQQCRKMPTSAAPASKAAWNCLQSITWKVRRKDSSPGMVYIQQARKRLTRPHWDFNGARRSTEYTRKWNNVPQHHPVKIDRCALTATCG